MDGVTKQSEEEGLLDPRALSKPRDLQVDAASAWAFVDTLDNGVVVIAYENGKVVECDNPNLTESESRHCKLAMEQNGDDANGQQGGQAWKYPTKSPTKPPTKPPTKSPTIPPTKSPTIPPTNSPTMFTTESLQPTDSPTPRGDPFVLRGIIWYDRNANGRRDSNVADPDHGRDVEFDVGLGGVQIQLTECDPETNEAMSMEVYSEGMNSYAGTISYGYDVNMHAMLINKARGGGKFELTNIRVARSYFIQVQAPSGYLFTGGVCNNNVEGWECESLAETFAAGGGRRQRRLSLRGLNTANVTAGAQVVNPDARLPSQRDLELGLREGRTDRCVSVDEAGVPDSRFDLGVMRVGDHNFADTDVVVGVDMIGAGRELHHSPHEGRSLLELIQERLMERHGRALDSHQQTKNSDGLYVYELAARDEEAIGEVTAEVIAVNLDRALERNGGVLDSVAHVGVTYYAPESARAGTRGEGGRLEVDLQVRGHYTANLNVDFDYIVEDSINRESDNIRRQLTSYNQNCNDQKEKVNDLGYTLHDFSEIQSKYGLEEQRQRQQDAKSDSEEKLAWSTACDKQRELPQFVEENLEALELRAQSLGKAIVVDDGGISLLAIVGIVGGLGVLALGFAYFLFRRGVAKKHQADEDEWFADESLDSVNLKIRQSNGPKGDLSEKSRVSGGESESAKSRSVEAGKPKGISGVVQYKLSNMTAALNSEWRLRRGGGDSMHCTTAEVACDNSMQESKYSSSRGRYSSSRVEGDSSLSKYSNSRAKYSRSSREGGGSAPRSRTSAMHTGISQSKARSHPISSRYSRSTGENSSTQRTNANIRKSAHSDINDSRGSTQRSNASAEKPTQSENDFESSLQNKLRLQSNLSKHSSREADHSRLHSLGNIPEGSVDKDPNRISQVRMENNVMVDSSSRSDNSHYAVPQIIQMDFEEEESRRSSDNASSKARSSSTASERRTSLV